jgi:serine/threonine-protein kinase SRPK3
MSELLGPMPKVITSQGKRSREFFLKSGELRNIKSLESWPLISVLKEKYRMQADDAESFASFLLPMLSYHPSLRASAVECLRHPWLKPTEDKKILSSNIVKNVQRTTKIQSIVSMDSPVVDANLKNTLSEDQGAELNNLEEQVEELRLDPHPLQNCAARRRCLSLG